MQQKGMRKWKTLQKCLRLDINVFHELKSYRIDGQTSIPYLHDSSCTSQNRKARSFYARWHWSVTIKFQLPLQILKINRTISFLISKDHFILEIYHALLILTTQQKLMKLEQPNEKKNTWCKN